MAETPLITYLRIQQATDRRVLASVRRAAVGVDQELRRLQARSGVGAAMRREQLVRSQAAINRRLESLFSELGDVTHAGRAAAAAAGAESILRESESLLKRMVNDADYRYLVESARASAEQSIEVMLQRVNGSSYVPLAQSVWGNQARSNATVGKLVEDALSRGDSAADLAKAVRGYVNPNTPGGVRYASMRLARTELNNAFHAAQVKQAQEEPWTTAVRWHLSGSHPRPDACNDYADSVHMKDGEPGLFDPDEVPVKPHPNCLCYTTPETPDPQDFINSFLDGRYDPYLEDMGLPDESIVVAKTPTPPPASPSTPAWSRTRTPKYVVDDLTRQAVRNLDPQDLASLEDYVQNGSFAPLNAGLRGVEIRSDSFTDMFIDTSAGIDPGWVQQEAGYLDAAIAKSKTVSDLTLYRGVEAADEFWAGLKRGTVIEDKGFMSASLNPEVAGEFGETVLRISYPAGRPALHIDAIEDLSLKQNEVLLPRGQRLVVKSVRKVDGKTVVNVEAQ